MPSVPIKVAVIGAGRLGARHAEKYAALEGAQLVAVCDVELDRAAAVAGRTGALPLADYTSLSGIDAVSIVVPTLRHHEIAAHFLDRGVHALVEKPLAGTLEQARDLVRLAESKGLKLQVGHIERFNPAFVGAQPFIGNPLFIEVHRIAPFSFRSLDIGVIMDLMIHDLDILLHIADSPLAAIHAHGACVITENEDIANARLEFESGCVANLTASRLGLKHERKFRIFQHQCYISLDFLAREGSVVSKGPGFERLDLEHIDREILDDPLEFLTRNLIRMHPIQAPEGADSLLDELAAFIAGVRGEAPILVPGAHGLRAIEVAERIRKAAKIARG